MGERWLRSGGGLQEDNRELCGERMWFWRSVDHPNSEVTASGTMQLFQKY